MLRGYEISFGLMQIPAEICRFLRISGGMPRLPAASDPPALWDEQRGRIEEATAGAAHADNAGSTSNFG